MASIKTEITEIVTGLALLGYRSLDQALSIRPTSIRHIEDEHFDRLERAYADGGHQVSFRTAWDNGVVFARATDGLRGRPPWDVEWKGPHRPPSYEQIPADLRVDHVYLLSCKYGSNIVFNASPWHLFDRGLAERRTERSDWYLAVAPTEYQALYRACRDELGELGPLPDQVDDLDREARQILKRALGGSRSWPGAAADAYRDFTYAVAHTSASRWREQLGTERQREEMLWRLLRFQAAPYFVLGASPSDEPLRYRVGTPWDFRDRFTVRGFDVWADAAGQPLVRWRADVIDRSDDRLRSVEGHVEVRWSHGRFAQMPEAKVYLDTPHHDVAGYHPLD